MTEALFTSFERSFHVRRLIGKYQGQLPGPTALFVAGLHGNEPAGIIALNKVFERLDQLKPDFKGTVIGISGNLEALRENKRFVDEDLNRNWDAFIDGVRKGELPGLVEDTQRNELLDLLGTLFTETNSELIVFDLHSTSVESIPFVSINDTLRNRRLVRGLPVPIILGLEEQMKGTLLSILSDLGISSLLFEAGQHEEWSSVENHFSFIWLMLEKLKCISPGSIPGFHRFKQVLSKGVFDQKRIFEVIHREDIDPKDNFIMRPDFVNFQKVTQGQHLAHDVKGPVAAPASGRIFMPLYQRQGNDGFFIARPVNPVWLRISEKLRAWKLDKAVGYLLGVKSHPQKEGTMLVNPRVTLKAIEFFHLLGYRKIRKEKEVLEVSRLRYDANPPTPEEVVENFKKMMGPNGRP